MTELEVMEVQPAAAMEAAAPAAPAEEADVYSAPSSEVRSAQPQKGQNFAVASMVLGIVGLVLAWPMGLVGGVLGIVFSQISKSALGYLDGKARAGLICGIIGLSIFVLVMVLFMGVWMFMFTTMVREAIVL